MPMASDVLYCDPMQITRYFGNSDADEVTLVTRTSQNLMHVRASDIRRLML
jgi:hypothetical protein